MDRERLTINEKTNTNKIGNSRISIGNDNRNKLSFIKGYKKLAVILFFFTAIIVFRFYVIDKVNVVGDSMKDTFLQGDSLLVRKYDVNNIKRFDVVIAKMNGQNVIKRVIGLPEETIYISEGRVYINDKEITGEFDFFTEDAGVADVPYQLEKDEYFLMGDNRSGSADSRLYGSVKLKDIKGIVVFRYYPFDRIQVINYGKDE